MDLGQDVITDDDDDHDDDNDDQMWFIRIRWSINRDQLGCTYMISHVMDYKPSTGSVPKKIAACIQNILNLSVIPIQFYWPSSLPLSEPGYFALAPLLAELAHLAMLFILQLMHTDSSVSAEE